MSLIDWNSKKRSGQDSEQHLGSTLDPEGPERPMVSRTFELSDVLLSRVSGEDSLFLLSYQLRRVENSEKTRNSVPLLLSLKAEGKELALLSGLLRRQVTIEEEPSFVPLSLAEVQKELQRLREDYENVVHENKVLKNSLMELQRPRRVS